jgi:hypothetical protein
MMKIHRILIITPLVLVALLITTGVGLAQVGAVNSTAGDNFSTVNGVGIIILLIHIAQ